MATREEKKTLKSAGKDEKKILKSLKKLQKYPRVRELFRIIASLFRRKKIRNIKEIAKNRDIRKTVEGLNYEERKMYAKQLKERGFPTLEEFLGSVKKEFHLLNFQLHQINYTLLVYLIFHRHQKYYCRTLS